MLKRTCEGRKVSLGRELSLGRKVSLVEEISLGRKVSLVGEISLRRKVSSELAAARLHSAAQSTIDARMMNAWRV